MSLVVMDICMSCVGEMDVLNVENDGVAYED